MGEDEASRLTAPEDGAPSFIAVGDERRRLALRRREGGGPVVIWLGGFRSDMLATKANALDAWAVKHGRAFLRFDYSGHGESDGRFEDGTISRWLEDSLAAIAARPSTVGGAGPILVGSSMGGWLALLAARELAATGTPPAGLVLLAPAPDFTECLIRPGLDAAARREIETVGVTLKASPYGPPVPITRALLEDGRRHLVLDGIVRTHAPVHILQGMNDPDVPWRTAATLIERLAGDAAVLTLIKDGDHRLSRPQDIARLLSAVAGIGD